MAACAGLLTSPNPEICARADEMIGGYRTRTRAFVPSLEAAQADADPAVRAAVNDAIAAVRGK